MAGSVARYVRFVSRIGRMVQPRAAQTLSLARSELTPPSIKAFREDLSKLRMPLKEEVTGMTMNELGGKALVLAELYLWFNLGIILGKGKIVGYGFTPDELEG